MTGYTTDSAVMGLTARATSRIGLGRVGLLAAVAFLTAYLLGCGGAQAEGASEEEGFTRILNVEVEEVSRVTFTETIRLTGTVQADKDVVISAEESGVIREIVVDKGRWVQEGQAIFRMDDELLSSQVEQARAMANLAQETWDRRKRLYEEDQVGSELAYLEAKYLAEQATANLSLLEERLARTVIRAPIGGILDSREIEVGTMVGPGTPVARIVDTNPVKITGGVPERYATDVRTGTGATVTFDVIPDQSFEGKISYVGAVVNPRNRTFPVELRLPNPGGMIKPEMVANVDMVRRTLEEAMVVPQEALIRVEEGYVVFTVETEDGVELVRSNPVELGPAQQNEAVILSGIEAGDRVIVVGQQSVAAGDRVTVVAGR
ncbi:MAG: efflux RND transporter periplasmic adaptor subunit [Gemmatimonadetes bacterium]|nr:efflux RND transporter periplasmic adaptor subunit [Gemmatimonadota bacterium]